MHRTGSLGRPQSGARCIPPSLHPGRGLSKEGKREEGVVDRRPSVVPPAESSAAAHLEHQLGRSPGFPPPSGRRPELPSRAESVARLRPRQRGQASSWQCLGCSSGRQTEPFPRFPFPLSDGAGPDPREPKCLWSGAAALMKLFLWLPHDLHALSFILCFPSTKASATAQDQCIAPCPRQVCLPEIPPAPLPASSCQSGMADESTFTYLAMASATDR
mmetsp:Transcript_36266/g.86054  ORF Transcript_36266/g.86054 Transcript_36266/m.86054 type:complete len:217 (+) Transcript_36266:316-966(+)